MNRYVISDLLLMPSLISLLRVPMAALFPMCIDRPAVAVALVALAGATDVLDGWIARTSGQATPTGALVDPITDKLFVLVVASTLLAAHRLTPVEVLWLAARDIGEIPLILWWWLSVERRQARADSPAANLPGKAATFVQFLVIVAAITGSSARKELVVAAGIAGTIAAAAYWWRELRRSRRSHATA